jgi:anti-sigma B factor antagonist
MSVENYPVRWIGQQAVIAFPEEVDITNAGQIRDRLLSVINQGAAALVVDLTATTFCDSACVNAIVRAYRRAVASSSQMRLAVVSPAVRRVLEITEIDHLIPVFASLDEALAGPGAAGGDSMSRPRVDAGMAAAEAAGGGQETSQETGQETSQGAAG